MTDSRLIAGVFIDRQDRWLMRRFQTSNQPTNSVHRLTVKNPSGKRLADVLGLKLIVLD